MPATPKRKKRKPAKHGARFLADALADNIRDYRALRRWSQETLAGAMRELGHGTWSGVTVSDVERGERTVSADELLGLAFMLNVEIVDLYDPTGLDGRQSAPVDIGIGIIGAAGIRAWLRGVIRVRTGAGGPFEFHIDSVRGHEGEYDEAVAAFDQVIQARPPGEAGDSD